MPNSYEIAFATDVGKVRRNFPNQDAIGVIKSGFWRRRPVLLIVADGMGGHKGGATASKMVVEAFKKVFVKKISDLPLKETIEKAVYEAHEGIREAAQTDPSLANMGSTVVAAVLGDHNLYMVNVGDSRLYLFEDGKIQQVSYDQSVIADMVRRGEISREEAAHHPQQNRLSMSISARREKVIHYSAELPLGSNDVVLLCTDGLWGTVPESLIRAIACQLKPDQAVKKLIKLANEFGGPDNVSVIIARRKGSMLENSEDEESASVG